MSNFHLLEAHKGNIITTEMYDFILTHKIVLKKILRKNYFY